VADFAIFFSFYPKGSDSRVPAKIMKLTGFCWQLYTFENTGYNICIESGEYSRIPCFIIKMMMMNSIYIAWLFKLHLTVVFAYLSRTHRAQREPPYALLTVFCGLDMCISFLARRAGSCMVHKKNTVKTHYALLPLVILLTSSNSQEPIYH